MNISFLAIIESEATPVIGWTNDTTVKYLYLWNAIVVGLVAALIFGTNRRVRDVIKFQILSDLGTKKLRAEPHFTFFGYRHKLR